MTDLRKVLSEYKARKAESQSKRREFIVRIGSAGLGLGAGAILAGCGGGGGGFGGPANGSSGSAPISEAEVRAAFLDIQKDENDHVTYLINAITGAAGAAAVRPRPTFDKNLLTASTTFGSGGSVDEQTLWKLSDALENTGPGAYLYAVPYINAGLPTVQAAASIAIVEGRHAGFLNILTGKNAVLTSPNTTPPDSQPPNPDTVDPTGFTLSQEIPQAPSQVAGRALPFLKSATGSIQPGNAPTGPNTGTGITYLNGGPGFPTDTFSDTAAPFSSNMTVNVLNYALFLEYLERDFYNINVNALYGGLPAYSVIGQNS